MFLRADGCAVLLSNTDIGRIKERVPAVSPSVQLFIFQPVPPTATCPTLGVGAVVVGGRGWKRKSFKERETVGTLYLVPPMTVLGSNTADLSARGHVSYPQQ